MFDTNLDTEIILIVKENGLIRLKDLIQKLQTSDSPREAPTIKAHLGKLNKIKKIAMISAEEARKYGKNETDGRAKYVILKGVIDSQKYLEKLLSTLEKQTPSARQLILKEIEEYNQVNPLMAKQINKITNIISADDPKTSDMILRVLYEEVVTRKKDPEDITDFRKKLEAFLKKLPPTVEGHINLRAYVICMLAKYSSKSVIEQIEKDFEQINDLKIIELIKNDYWQESTASIIETNRMRLFDLSLKILSNADKEKSLIIKGTLKTKAQILSQIMHRARNLLGITKEMGLTNEEVDQK